jgi:hypothetical protein
MSVGYEYFIADSHSMNISISVSAEVENTSCTPCVSEWMCSDSGLYL